MCDVIFDLQFLNMVDLMMVIDVGRTVVFIFVPLFTNILPWRQGVKSCNLGKKTILGHLFPDVLNCHAVPYGMHVIIQYIQHCIQM